MSEKEHGEKCHCWHEDDMEGLGGLISLDKDTKNEFKMAILKRREKILEAKLEFIREINALIKKAAQTKEA